MYLTSFPIFTSRDLARASAFYVEHLDAKVTYRFPPEGAPVYLSLQIGASPFGLGLDPTTPEGPSRASLWVYVEDCDAAVERLRVAGATVSAEPADQPWGERVARVLDPDGMTLVLGQHPA